MQSHLLKQQATEQLSLIQEKDEEIRNLKEMMLHYQSETRDMQIEEIKHRESELLDRVELLKKNARYQSTLSSVQPGNELLEQYQQRIGELEHLCFKQQEALDAKEQKLCEFEGELDRQLREHKEKVELLELRNANMRNRDEMLGS